MIFTFIIYKKHSAAAECFFALFIMIDQRLDLLLIDPPEQEQCYCCADHLGDGERPPDMGHFAGEAQKIGSGQQGDELTAQGNDGGVDAVAQRLEAGAKADTDGSQTGNVTSVLSGTALSYDPDADTATCVDCGLSELAYWVYVPNGDVTQSVENLVVVGGGMNLVNGTSAQIPVRFLMEDGSLVVPDYTLLTYTPASSAIATVSASGLVTAAGVGTTTIAVKITADQTKTATVPVTVTAS